MVGAPVSSLPVALVFLPVASSSPASCGGEPAAGLADQVPRPD
jgi:hypothetical protein